MKAFDPIVNELYTTLATLPDKRTGANVQFPMQDIGLTAFSVFFMQSPSFLYAQESFLFLTPFFYWIRTLTPVCYLFLTPFFYWIRTLTPFSFLTPFFRTLTPFSDTFFLLDSYTDTFFRSPSFF